MDQRLLMSLMKDMAKWETKLPGGRWNQRSIGQQSNTLIGRPPCPILQSSYRLLQAEMTDLVSDVDRAERTILAGRAMRTEDRFGDLLSTSREAIGAGKCSETESQTGDGKGDNFI